MELDVRMALEIWIYILKSFPGLGCYGVFILTRYKQVESFLSSVGGVNTGIRRGYFLKDLRVKKHS